MKPCFFVLLIPAVFATVPLPARAQSSAILQSVQVIAQSDELTPKAEQFIDLLAAGNFAAALEKYDRTARQNVSVESLQSNWQDLEAKFGPLKRNVSSQTINGEDVDVVVFTAEFEKDTVDLLIVFDKNSNISSFTYPENP